MTKQQKRNAVRNNHVRLALLPEEQQQRLLNRLTAWAQKGGVPEKPTRKRGKAVIGNGPYGPSGKEMKASRQRRLGAK